VLLLAQLSPQPKLQIDRFSHFCTAHGRKSLYFAMGDHFPKIALFLGGTGPPSNSWFLEPDRPDSPSGITIGSAVFTQVTAECPYTSQCNAPFPLKIAPSQWGDLDPHLLHGSLGPPESSTQIASRSVQPFLQGSLMWQTTLLGR